MSPVRKATREELPPLQRMLVKAFADDAPMNFILQGGARRELAFETYFRVAVERLTWPFGEVYTDDGLRGAALWTPPGKWRLRWYQHLRDLPSWGKAIGFTRLSFIERATAELTAAHPHEPHFYLLALGVDPLHRGQGLASALLQPVLSRCDREGLPAYLEASGQTLVRFYQRFGFALRQEVRLGGGGPPLFLMWRPTPPRGGDPGAGRGTTQPCSR